MSACVVVGTDLTESSDSALICAERRAASDGARLIVVHATPPAFWRSSDFANRVETAKGQIRERMSLLTPRQPYEYDVVVEQGFPHLVLARIAAFKSALLIVGSKSARPGTQARLRDVGERILRLGYGPLLVARQANGCSRILVALDRPLYLSAASCLPAAAAEQRRNGARLLVLHCLNATFLETLVTDLANGGAYAHEPLGRCSEVAAAYHELEAEVRRHGLHAETRVLQGAPERLIPGLALELGADLIVVGSGHHRANAGPLLATLHDAPCSVLVVKSQVPDSRALLPDDSHQLAH